MLKRLLSLGAVLVAVLAAGCASVPMASLESDTAAKNFAPKHGKANIYVYRNESFGAALKMPVMLDAQNVGSTAAKTYLLLEVAPGSHTVLSNTENSPTVTFNTSAGRNYFVWQEVKMGAMSARSALHIVDEATGKAGVAECKLVAGTQ
jgi:hypothetical protein